MNTANSHSVSLLTIISGKITDYLMLVKFRLSLMVVFSSVAAFILAYSGPVNYELLLWLAVGGFLITGAANAINQVFEKEFDKLMHRTANRPLPAGRMTLAEAILAAGIMAAGGIAILSLAFSQLAGLLGTLSLISYSFIYTPMKRLSPAAVFVGAFPGSLPLIIGWVCATGTLGFGAWVLFAIQFLWQFPHFWAIAWVAHDDYTRAGFKLLPSNGRNKYAAMQNIIYIAALIPVSLLPAFLGITGTVSAIVIVLAGLLFMLPAIQLYRTCDKKDALRLMFASFIYLPVVLISFLLDKM